MWTMSLLKFAAICAVWSLACWFVSWVSYQAGRRRGFQTFEESWKTQSKKLYQACGECGSFSEHAVLVHLPACSFYRTTRITRFVGGTR